MPCWCFRSNSHDLRVAGTALGFVLIKAEGRETLPSSPSLPRHRFMLAFFSPSCSGLFAVGVGVGVGLRVLMAQEKGALARGGVRL